MRLLRLISWPYLKKHAVRSLLTIVGIVLGVAVFVGMHTANQAVFYAFERTVDRIAGAAQLQVTSGETGFPEEVLERVQSIPDVQVAVPVIEAPAATHLQGQGNVLILGVDRPAIAASAITPESGARRSSTIRWVLAQPTRFVTNYSRLANLPRRRPHVSTMIATRRFPRAHAVGRLTSAFGGNLAVMDSTQRSNVLGTCRRFDRIT